MTPEEQAAHLFASCGWRSTGQDGLEKRVANLIRAERSRCASIAEAMGCEAVAAEIRKGEGNA